MKTEAGKMLNVDAALTKFSPVQASEFINLQNSMFVLSQSFLSGSETESSVYNKYKLQQIVTNKIFQLLHKLHF
ncbi:hypothetical protein NBY38_27205 (plasmid) [Klebsiella pneumoniae]|uniref:hypothetical protein n=1 Tax=Klebsiella pneumoniae TaxID=573 RepID=UPI0020301120|nr:hypothetical protein [Klebsiella pneumoniae]MCM1597054.1 hypothetical protein [Klebsiella pneumoniae]